MNPRTIVSAVAAAGVLVAAAQGRANCAAPTDYLVVVNANTVTVQPENFQNRTCPDPDGLLRQNVQDGQVVRLADYCQPSQYGAPHYVDECVAPGSYRYGFATPYTCASSSCGTYFFATATVTEPLLPQCARSAENAAPSPVASAPWTAERLICSYAGEAGYPRDAAPAANAEDAGSSDSSGSGGGCSATSTTAVLLVNALVVAAGLLGLRRARSS